jgi:cyclic beta-1,2-glucan synthetase
MQGNLFRLIHRINSSNWLNRRGGIFVLRQDQMSEADFILLQVAARVVLQGSRGSLGQQLADLYHQPARLPPLMSMLLPEEATEPAPPLLRPEKLQFDNGRGGFSPEGHEYIIYLQPGEMTPAPWINVIANETFGFLVSETGGGYSWAINSGENRLSPWRNDPVTDLPGELLYLRDEETAEIWTPTPQPAPAAEPYLVRHGAGYTIFEHHSHGLRQQLRLFAAPDAPLKIVQLRVENSGSRPRRLTATYYLEWVLGTQREATQQYIVTEYDEEHQALLARNPYNSEFSARVAFVAANKRLHGLTADRTEFLGRLGNLSQPAGLKRIGLEGRVEAGLDPCAALQLHLDLAPGAAEEIYFLVGQGPDREESRALIRQYQAPEKVAAAWQAVQKLWDDILGTVQVETPDAAMNLLLNRWLLYQSLACRIWGRSALYQSSGAYGFRDQLQDVMALLHARPDLARAHLLRAARHQFTEGDVLHWWHPPSGRGVRTLIRDDLLWLPFVTAHYVAVTGDETILQEEAPFLKGEPLKEKEEERYGHFDSYIPP